MTVEATQADRDAAQGMVLVPRKMVEFLMGSGELNGLWFGDATSRGQFWRRDELKNCDAHAKGGE